MTLILHSEQSLYKQLDYKCRHKTTGKPLESKKVLNNTRLVRSNEAMGVKLHDTIVWSVDRDDNITLDSGGWYTMTTADRINAFMPMYLRRRQAYQEPTQHYRLPQMRLYSSKSEWRVQAAYPRGVDPNEPHYNIPFWNGMTLHKAAGDKVWLPDWVEVHQRKTEAERRVAHNEAMKKLIKPYARDVFKALGSHDHHIKVIDCQLCLPSPMDHTKMIGDEIGEFSHLLDHVIHREIGRMWLRVVRAAEAPNAYQLQKGVERFLSKRLLMAAPGKSTPITPTEVAA